MPTNQNLYNSRVTDESLEKKFRDTFTSQGGSELVSDLYAQGVIVPIVDFTAAAEGSVLSSDLQQAWDFSTGNALVSNTTTTVINTPGFWKVDLVATLRIIDSPANSITVNLTDGITSKPVWRWNGVGGSSTDYFTTADDKFIVFLRSGDSLSVTAASAGRCNIWYRQIADVSGDLVNPLGFTSS